LAYCNTEDEVIEVAQDADGIISQYAPITRRVIESLKKCKVIVRYGVGVDSIDIKVATEHKIIVANVPDFCIDEVSTHTMALILACARGIILLDRKIKKKKWDFTLAKLLFRTQMLQMYWTQTFPLLNMILYKKHSAECIVLTLSGIYLKNGLIN
jgi:D-3-phosphoglycerate dehydrogenase